MNEDLKMRDNSKAGVMLMALSLGALVGAGVALLVAPDSGKNTRRRMTSTARRWGTNAAHTLDEARNRVVELGTDAKSAIKAGQNAFLNDRASRRVTRSGEIAKRLDGVMHVDEAAPR